MTNEEDKAEAQKIVQVISAGLTTLQRLMGTTRTMQLVAYELAVLVHAFTTKNGGGTNTRGTRIVVKDGTTVTIHPRPTEPSQETPQ